MKRKLLVAFGCAAVVLARPLQGATLPAATTPPAATAVAAPSAAEAEIEGDDELEVELRRADAAYDAGLRQFHEGEPERGRAEMARAFDIIVTAMEDETLPISLRSDFSSMLDKIRTWNEADDADRPSGLDVTEDALRAAAIASTTTVANRHRIRIDGENPITQKFIQIYTKTRPKTVEEALARSGRYRGMIESELKAKGLPPELFYLVMTESEYKYDALSYAGAAGLWQFMPATARKYGLEVSYWIDERYSPEKATPAAIRYLSDLYQWFGDWNLAIAAYNRGEGGLGKDMAYSRSNNFDSLAGRNALPEQTHHYVPKFMACVLIGRDPAKFGLHPKYDDPPAFDTVKLPRSLDLAVAAKCAGVSEAVIHELNPQIRTWATPKDRPDFVLRIPVGTKEAFASSLAKVDDWNPGPTMLRYKVRPGDSLGRIAKLNHTTVHGIMATNKISNPRLIRPGMVLLIRPGRAAAVVKHHARR